MLFGASVDALCDFIKCFQNLRKSERFSEMLWCIREAIRTKGVAPDEDSIRSFAISKGYEDEFEAFADLIYTLSSYK